MSKKQIADSPFGTFCDQVHVPFKIRIPAGQSTFSLNVPKIFRDRQFYFSSFFLTPNFYSLEATVEDLEDPEVMNTPIEYGIMFKLTFKDKNSLYLGTFELDKSIIKTAVVAQKINEFFEAHKPSACLHLGIFFDWIDKRFEDEGHSWEDLENYMKTKAPEYYNQPLDPAKHFNALPPSARKMYGVNNYLFPTVISDDILENIRFRLWMAPNTNAYLSTDGQLLCMGFSDEQIGDRGYKKKFVIENDNSNMGFTMIEAQYAFVEKIPKELGKNLLKIDLKLHDTIFITYEIPISIKKVDTLKNENYFPILKEVLDILSYYTNFQITASYDVIGKKFKFFFPHYSSISTSSLSMPIELSERLGFGMVNEITNVNAEGAFVDDDIDVTNTEKKARALGYDTGMILVTNESFTSNSMKGISDQLMCTIYPTATGVYEISPLESCFSPPTMSLSNYYPSGHADLRITFKLYRFLDSNQPVPLDWKNPAFVYGQFRGFHYSHNTV
jgi:hypothetical protein